MSRRPLIPGVKNVNDLRLYTIWSNMKSRCYDSKRSAYRYYGAKGVKLCDDWCDNFVSFYDWANANGYQENLTIDRIDSNKDYCPENCQWITRSENSRKQKHSTFKKSFSLNKAQVSDIRSTDRTLKEHATIYKVSVSTIHRVLKFKSYRLS